MSFFLLSLLVYGALTASVAAQVGAATEEWGFTLGHFAVAAAGNALLLPVARRRSLAFLGSPALAFLVMNQVYFTVNALKYFSPILLYPQFDLSLTAQLWGSVAGGSVLMVCLVLLRYRGAPTAQSMRVWILRHRADLSRLLVFSAIVSVVCKLALLSLGYGSAYTEADYGATGARVRSYEDFFLILGSELFGLFALWLGITFLAGSRRVTGAGPLLRLFAAMALFVELAYSVGYLKARAPLLLAAVLFALTSELASRRRAERILQTLLLALPAVSLLGIQLTLLLGRVNLPEDTGLRFAIAAINRRTDLTDFATAIVVNSGGSAYDPAIVPAAVLNAVPRFLFVGAEKVVPDVYSEVLGGVGWEAYSDGVMLADYQDSIFSAGVMAGSVLGFFLLPIALTLLFEAVARLAGPYVSRPLFGFVFIPLWLSATHIEVEWATILLNFRQAFTLTVVSLILTWVLRLIHHVLVIASRPPGSAPAHGHPGVLADPASS
jgi:hypothetical protein